MYRVYIPNLYNFRTGLILDQIYILRKIYVSPCYNVAPLCNTCMYIKVCFAYYIIMREWCSMAYLDCVDVWPVVTGHVTYEKGGVTEGEVRWNRAEHLAGRYNHCG